MHKKNRVEEAILEQKLLPLYYHDSPDVSVSVLKALYEAGIRVVEYTSRGTNALQNFKILKEFAEENMKGLFLGMGTIKTRKQAKKFIEEEADFIVCPVINEDIAELANENNLLWIPGCITPTEIALAEECKARIIKLFPGNLLRPSYVQSIKEIFPDLKFIPTGGVEPTEHNLRDWFNAGVVAVGMGSKLISNDLIRNNDFSGIKDTVINTLNIIKKIHLIL